MGKDDVLERLYRATKEMRDAQKNYYRIAKTNDVFEKPKALAHAKSCEKKVDELLELVEKEKDNRQARLL